MAPSPAIAFKVRCYNTFFLQMPLKVSYSSESKLETCAFDDSSSNKKVYFFLRSGKSHIGRNEISFVNRPIPDVFADVCF